MYFQYIGIIQGLKKTPLKRYGVTPMFLTSSQNEHYVREVGKDIVKIMS